MLDVMDYKETRAAQEQPRMTAGPGNCVTWGELLTLSEPLFHHLPNGKNSICSTNNLSLSPTSLQINETQTMVILFGVDNYRGHL